MCRISSGVTRPVHLIYRAPGRRYNLPVVPPQTQVIRLRIGAVPYLNARPLVFGLEAYPGSEIVYDTPRRLAAMLTEGTLDVGLVPSIAYPGLRHGSIVPGIAIASHGAVQSVLLASSRPVEKIRSLALDTSSLSSIAMAQVLCYEKFGVWPEMLDRDPGVRVADLDADASVLIGDPAMVADLSPFPYVYDLGQEWTEFTGRPFVYALWLARAPVPDGNLVGTLLEAKARGVEHIDEIAQSESQRLGLTHERCRDYLTRCITYDLGEEELAGLRRFYELCSKHGLSPPADLKFCA